MNTNLKKALPTLRWLKGFLSRTRKMAPQDRASQKRLALAAMTRRAHDKLSLLSKKISIAEEQLLHNGRQP